MYYTFKKRTQESEPAQLTLFSNPTNILNYKEYIITTELTHCSENQIQKAKQLEQNFLTKAIHIINNFTEPITNTMQEYYNTFKIPKRTHGFREINAPIENLKYTQRQIAQLLTYLDLIPHNAAYAYVQERSHYNAIKVHQANNSRWFLKLDIKDFFPSCSETLVLTKLINLYPIHLWQNETLDILKQLIHLCCLNGTLPQGSPASPLLSNLIFIEYDHKITKYLKQSLELEPLIKQKYVYTRYADDICISGHIKFNWRTLYNFIQNNVLSTDFILKQEKTRFGSTAGRNWNLGLMLNKDNQITIGAENKRNLKAMLHNFITAEKNDNPYSIPELQHLLGVLNYAKQIEPDYISFLIHKYSTKYQLNIIETIRYRLKAALR